MRWFRIEFILYLAYSLLLFIISLSLLAFDCSYGRACIVEWTMKLPLAAIQEQIYETVIISN